MINVAVVSGHLVKDAEVTQLPSGGTVANFVIVYNERRKNAQTQEWEDIPNFFEVRFYDNSGTRLAWMQQYLTKGFMVTVQGRLRQERWTDKQTQQTRTKISISASDIVANWPKKQGYQPQTATYAQTPQAYQMQQPQMQPMQQPMQQPIQQPMQYQQADVYDDNIPF